MLGLNKSTSFATMEALFCNVMKYNNVEGKTCERKAFAICLYLKWKTGRMLSLRVIEDIWREENIVDDSKL